MKLNLSAAGITFTQHIPKHQTPFERLFEIFKELITHTCGDFDEAIDWLRELEIKGRKSLRLAPQAIPLFSTKSNLNHPQSTIGPLP